MDLLDAAINGRSPRNNHAVVVDELGHEIVAGTYPVGEPLPNDAELAARFGVSRTVLREAMKTLAAKGLVSPRARVGTRVTEPTLWNMFDADVLAWHMDGGVTPGLMAQLSEMRLGFEPHAAGLAAGRASPADIARLEEEAESMAAASSNEDFARADLRFHLVLLAAARNPFLYSVGALIEAALVATFKLSSPAEDPALRGSVAAAHRGIVAAVAAADAALAAARTREVIVMGRTRVDRALEIGGD